MTRMGTDNGVDFGIGKHFRQEDRICRKEEKWWIFDVGFWIFDGIQHSAFKILPWSQGFSEVVLTIEVRIF
jgi:NADH dehydrogenase/NADH:ubiquinone oxidoreductase subunit G